ncbi:ABC transporter permease [Streptosporangium sp. NPDC004631]
MTTTETTAAPTRTGLLRRRPRPPILVVVSLLILLVVVVSAVAGVALAPDDPDRQRLALGVTGPGAGHPLGTDDLGRDILSRLIAGTRIAVVGPLIVAVVTVVVGTTLGMLSALRGGWTDTVISRFVDFVYALPALLMAVVVVGVVDGGYPVALGVFVFFSAPVAIRLVRSATQSQARLPYIDAARTLGMGDRRILFVHLLPNVMPTVVATGLLDYVGALVGLSSLAFLGLGVAPGTADWGLMLADSRSYLDLNPWAALAPALAIILTASAVTVLGDWMYDRFSMGVTR